MLSMSLGLLFFKPRGDSVEESFVKEAVRRGAKIIDRRQDSVRLKWNKDHTETLKIKSSSG